MIKNDKQYIGYIEVEELLKKLSRLKILLLSLELEMKNLYIQAQDFVGSKDDILYSLAVCNRVLSDVSLGKTAPGDKINNIIFNYEKKLNAECLKAGQEIYSEILVVGGVVSLMQQALYNLNETEREVLISFYFEKRTWKEISSSLGIELTQAKVRRKHAIEVMLEGLRISHDNYNCWYRWELRRGKTEQ
jgi:Sigma-70, region 4.